ncbi:16074_t:CDS:2, partial [Funneliformis geosporum]
NNNKIQLYLIIPSFQPQEEDQFENDQLLENKSLLKRAISLVKDGNNSKIQSEALPDLELPNIAMINIMEFLLKILEENFNWLVYNLCIRKKIYMKKILTRALLNAHMRQTVTSRCPVFSSLLTALEANPIPHSDVNASLEVEVNAIPLSNAENSVEIPQEEME